MDRSASGPSGFTRLYGPYALAIAVWGVGTLAIRAVAAREAVPVWVNGLLAVATTVPFFLVALLARRVLRHDLDELERRVALEGFAFALAIFVPLAALYASLRHARVYVPHLDPPDIVMTPAVLVLIGVTLAWRRYR